MNYSRAFRLAVMDALLLSVTGCSRYYWGKAGVSETQFKADNDTCLSESKGATPATARYGVVVQDVYRACLRSKGYERDKKFDPPPAGWYRGYEDRD